VKEDTLVVHEIYASIQGESTFAGLSCTFVRLTGCNLRCVWCDTPQAFYGGTRMSRAEVLERALAHATPLVELTGGEPLLQPGALPLMRELADAGKTIFLTTHYMFEADAICDLIAVINKGSIVAEGTPSSIKRVVENQGVVEFEVVGMPNEHVAGLRGLPGVS